MSGKYMLNKILFLLLIFSKKGMELKDICYLPKVTQ